MEFTHLVQKQGASVGGFKPAGPIPQGAGERAPGMSKKLALVKFPGNRSAVDPDKRPLAARAVLVDLAGDQSLPGPVSPRINTLASDTSDCRSSRRTIRARWLCRQSLR
jgi:hypothetical protein